MPPITESQLLADFLSGSSCLAACLTEPDANKDDIDLLVRRPLRILSILSSRPLTSAMHQLVASAGFFQQVDLLNALQKAKVVHALHCLQSHTRAQALELSTRDVEEGCYKYPASRGFDVVYSWAEGDSPKAIGVVPRVDDGVA